MATIRNLFQLEKNRVLAILAVFLVAGVILILTTDGTADEGDSVMHFLFARDAFQYPAHFFNQWAKPVYVLITAPVAQLGFEAVQFFNLLCSVVSLWLTFKTAKKLGIAHAWIAPLLAIAAPMLMIVSLSGLTEPLFAVWLMTGVYGLIAGKKISAVIWLSFLPFVRSEGLIVLCVILLYLIIKKSFKHIPLLLTGHLIYAIAGYPFYNDLFWIFKTLSYATLNSAYGQGDWMHFIRHLPEVIGIPLCFLLGGGVIYGVYVFIRKYFQQKTTAISTEELFLVYGVFFANFIGHTAFWALGIFNSFGLMRVLIGVLPLAALISLRGLNMFSDIFKSLTLRYILLAAVITYPFTGHRYAFHRNKDFELKADQKAELKMAQYVKQHFPDYKKQAFYYEACWISLVLDINHFDPARHKRFLHAFENDFPTGSFLVWDDWFAPVEGLVELKQLAEDGKFELLHTFEEKDPWGNTRTVKLFRTR